MNAIGYDPVEAPAPAARSRAWWLALLAYPLLALLGAITHRHGFSLAAAIVLASVPLAPSLLARRRVAWLSWVALIAGLLALAWYGLLLPALDTLPVLVNGFLAWLFGRSLRAGGLPLIARFIVAVEDEGRLALPGVARYARQLTVFWTMLFGAQALLIAMLLLVLPGDPWHLRGAAARWALVYVHAGAYVLMGLAFALEYPFRRWHLRHLPHPRLHEFASRLATSWPRLVGEHLRGAR